MSQLEPLVLKLQAMTSFDELPDFFSTVQTEYHYKFCGLVLWRADDQRDVVAAKPNDDFESVISQEALRQLCLKRFTPMLGPELGAALKIASDALVVPLKGKGSDTAALIIGLQPQQITMAQQIGWYWSIVANYLYEAINRFMAVSATEDDFILTCREHACLNWAAKGKTSWEISQILAISERTVNFHLSNCIRKTNSCNRQQAISKCVAGGHIHM
jgi:DNA-binding CsgD family transcriptional regulator